MRLFEMAAPLLFFGVFAQEASFQKAGEDALQELKDLGYEVSLFTRQPIAVYPLEGKRPGTWSGHGGRFEPGRISIRPAPQGDLTPQHFLRHELAHSASYASCRGKLPLWAEELFALGFAGGLEETAQEPSAADIAALQEAVQRDLPLTPQTQATLIRLGRIHGMPHKACEIPAKIRKILSPDTDFAFLITSLLSGRVFAAAGDQKGLFPLGSVLKIPYAAAVLVRDEKEKRRLDKALLASDAQELETFPFDASVYEELILPLEEKPLTDYAGRIGLRDNAARQGIGGSLPRALEMMRNSMLYNAEQLARLEQNGKVPDSTLFGAKKDHLKVLEDLAALTKTGTVSTIRGLPQWGYLAVAWPMPKPTLIAIFRQPGVVGKEVLPKAAQVLKRFMAEQRFLEEAIEVRVLPGMPKASWHVETECGALKARYENRVVTASRCGLLKVVTPGSSVRKTRYYAGLLSLSAPGPALLATDPLTYAEAVATAEAGHLDQKVKQALMAIVIWNAQHSQGRRHQAQGFPSYEGLCDTSHCSVFLGHLKPELNAVMPRELPELLSTLHRLKAPPWLMFANGGDEPWQRRIPVREMAKALGIEVFAVKRLREKDGSITLMVHGTEEEALLPCERFRSLLKLPSCPDSVTEKAGGDYVLQGKGAGHGEGFSLLLAQKAAAEGVSSRQLLEQAYHSF